MNVGGGALGVSTDELFTCAAVADGENGGNEIEHFQCVRLVLVEEVHAVSHLHDVGAVRMSVVLQDELEEGGEVRGLGGRWVKGETRKAGRTCSRRKNVRLWSAACRTCSSAFHVCSEAT